MTSTACSVSSTVSGGSAGRGRWRTASIARSPACSSRCCCSSRAWPCPLARGLDGQGDSGSWLKAQIRVCDDLSVSSQARTDGILDDGRWIVNEANEHCPHVSHVAAVREKTRAGVDPFAACHWFLL